MIPTALTELSALHATAWRNLLTQAFSGDYLADFPVWDLAIPVKARRVVAQCGPDGSVRGGAGARIVQLQLVGGGQTTGAFIGAVATHADQRRKGIAERCIKDLLAWAHAQGAQWCALWGAEHAYYGKFGFTLEGVQSRFALRVSPPKYSEQWEWRQGFNPRLIPLLQKQRLENGGLQLTEADYGSWFARHSHVQWWSAWRDGSPLAYLAEGRGMDLVSFVHEWGGDRGALQALLLHLARLRRGLQILAHPQHLPQLGEAVLEPAITEGLALMRFESDADRALRDRFWFWGLDSA